jgi:hypothetical protein
LAPALERFSDRSSALSCRKSVDDHDSGGGNDASEARAADGVTGGGNRYRHRCPPLRAVARTITHNVLLLLFAAGIFAAAQRSAGATKATLIGLGLFNVACAAYGLINVRYGSTLWVPAGEVDNWFHLVLGAVLIGLGLIRGPKNLDRERP